MSRLKGPRTTSSRKKQHVDLAVSGDVGFRAKTTGLEHIEFVNNALPEINLSEVDTAVSFLGRTIRLPFMVSCMTGGYADALTINRSLATVCEEFRIPLGVGSQRQVLENDRFRKTFQIVRERAPSVPVIGNIGAAEVAGLRVRDAERLVKLVRADALAVHLNPLQELLQPEGNPNFRGVLDGIRRLVGELSVPVIVKEIGAGISGDVARRLLEAGVRHIDVAGAGGTSWAGIEILRAGNNRGNGAFWDWGIPLVPAIRALASLRSKGREFTLIASGGVHSGLDGAKCIALGADLVASARPVLVSLRRGGISGLRRFIRMWEEELRGVMFLTGSRTVADLRGAILSSYQRP